MDHPDMFQDVVDPSVKVGDRSFRSLPVSVLLHGAGALVIAVVALTAGDVIPTPPVMLAFVAPVAPAPAPPPPPPPPVASRPPQDLVPPNPAAAPVAAPSEIRPESGIEPTSAVGVAGGVDGGIPGGVVGLNALPEAPPPPPPPPQEPVRVGGNIKAPVKIKDIAPIYPTIAARARIHGVVIVEATIGADGKVKDARILRSIPLLDQSALDAVRQWEYIPTLVNGVPCAVVMVVTVTFQLTGLDAITLTLHFPHV